MTRREFRQHRNDIQYFRNKYGEERAQNFHTNVMIDLCETTVCYVNYKTNPHKLIAFECYWKGYRHIVNL